MVHFVHFYALIFKLNAGFLYVQKITTETVSNHIRKTVTKLILYMFFFQRQEPRSIAIVCMACHGYKQVPVQGRDQLQLLILP